MIALKLIAIVLIMAIPFPMSMWIKHVYDTFKFAKEEDKKVKTISKNDFINSLEANKHMLDYNPSYFYNLFDKTNDSDHFQYFNGTIKIDGVYYIITNPISYLLADRKVLKFIKTRYKEDIKCYKHKKKLK